jgi:hypothetical protein
MFRSGERSPQGPKPGDDLLGRGNYRYFILHDGERYPVKEIIRLAVRLATGDWPGRFWGGRESNTYVRNRGFIVEERPGWDHRRAGMMMN